MLLDLAQSFEEEGGKSSIIQNEKENRSVFSQSMSDEEEDQLGDEKERLKEVTKC